MEVRRTGYIRDFTDRRDYDALADWGEGGYCRIPFALIRDFSDLWIVARRTGAV